MKSLNHTFNVVMEVVIGAVLLVFLLLQIPASGIHSSASFETIEQKMTAGLDPNVFAAQDPLKVHRYLGVDPSAFEKIALFRSDDAMSASEMVVVQFANDEQKQQFEQAVQKRIDSQHDIYSGYAPEQAAVMENALMSIQDNYGLYYAGDNPAGAIQLFEQVLREGDNA